MLMDAHREASRISHPDMPVELLTDRTDVIAAVRRLTAEARREVRVFDRPPYVDRPSDDILPSVRAGEQARVRASRWSGSERTTQRRIQRVMAQLGAPTRFQAGLLATRRGRL
ncbi:hypothetical protein N4G69_51770 [Streptomyces mirabilis]|uniref:hypothetical protein n=1 Tax=Streptomyces mirabilis TaxID=68239 RepID=UPI0021BFCD80|nr:hypothetical protein [Streptomyces mirabilis]MCT9113851.1 hypothetical protein [Streptomyces mirabilis]